MYDVTEYYTATARMPDTRSRVRSRASGFPFPQCYYCHITSHHITSHHSAFIHSDGSQQPSSSRTQREEGEYDEHKKCAISLHAYAWVIAAVPIDEERRGRQDAETARNDHLPISGACLVGGIALLRDTVQCAARCAARIHLFSPPRHFTSPHSSVTSLHITCSHRDRDRDSPPPTATPTTPTP